MAASIDFLPLILYIFISIRNGSIVQLVQGDKSPLYKMEFERQCSNQLRFMPEYIIYNVGP